MGTVFSIRGTNGSGKTTLARAFLPPNLKGDRHGGPVDLNWYPSPTKRYPARQLRAEGYALYAAHGTVGVIGRYDSACGGMDRMPDFAVCRGAISHMLNDLQVSWVIAEGLLASGVYGSWGAYSKEIKERGHAFAFVYLATPLEVCKARIKARQQAVGKVDKVINWQLVDDKYSQVIRNRQIALEHGELVYDLPFGEERAALGAIMVGQGERYRGS